MRSLPHLEYLPALSKHGQRLERRFRCRMPKLSSRTVNAILMNISLGPLLSPSICPVSSTTGISIRARTSTRFWAARQTVLGNFSPGGRSLALAAVILTRYELEVQNKEKGLSQLDMTKPTLAVMDLIGLEDVLLKIGPRVSCSD